MISKPEILTNKHILAEFDCGREQLTVWLQRHALTNQAARHAMTKVVTAESAKVVGYFSYNVIPVEHSDWTPDRVSKGLAKQPIPVFLVARLAVDLKYQGQGLGRRLFRNALQTAMTVQEVVPVRALIVDAIDEQAKHFYQQFGFEPFPSDKLRLWLLMKDLLRNSSV